VTVAVVDASVLVAALLDEGANGRWAEQRVAAFDLAGPHHTVAEAANIVRRLTGSGRLSEQEGALAHADLLRVDLQLFPFAPFALRAWELRANVTAYDAWYVALAEALGCSLYTLDARLSRAPGLGCPVLLPKNDADP
jgi:predicted nucleic acid-binding protein